MNKPRDLTGHEKEDLPKEHRQHQDGGKTGQKPEPAKKPAKETPSRNQPRGK